MVRIYNYNESYSVKRVVPEFLKKKSVEPKQTVLSF